MTHDLSCFLFQNNVSLILVDEPNGDGLLYAIGTFLPIMGFWIAKTQYDARYVYEDDLLHRLLQYAILVTLGTAVLHVRPIAIMSDTYGNNSMFIFALMLVVERVLTIFRLVEVYFNGIGEPAIKRSACVFMKGEIWCIACYIASAAVAGLDYYRYGREGGGNSESLTLPSGNNKNNIPIILCLVGYIGHLLLAVIHVFFCFPKGGLHKQQYV